MTSVAALAADPARFRLTPLEIAGGGALGLDPGDPGLPDVPERLTPLQAFEDAILPALERSPCLVTFSGGRDSSALLAVAAHVARREGLEPPIPVTLRLRDALGAGEREWQERVAAHLGVDDWMRLEVGEEIDFIGPIARPLLVRHGVVHPAPLPLFWLPLERARGGSLLTGYGGDSVTGGWLPRHSAEVLAGRATPSARDAGALAYACAPPLLRRTAMRLRLTRQAWLRPEAWREFRRLRAAELGSRPVRWNRFLVWEARLRRSCAIEVGLARLAADVDVKIAHPLRDRRFMAALARAGGSRGFGNRTAVMRALFSDYLPGDVLARADKANFTLAFFRGDTRAFARRWDGRGLDPDLVDAEALRAVWLSPVVDTRSAYALQAAWLDSAERGLEQHSADVAEHGRVGGSP